MSLFNYTPAPTQPWASTFQPIIPRGLPSLGQSGLGSLPGSAGGILARGLPQASLIPRSLPGFASGGGLAAQVPVGVGQQAFNAASALGGGGGGTSAAQALGRAGARASLPGALGATGMSGFAARAGLPIASGFAANTIFGKGDENPLTEAARGFTSGAGWGAAAAPFVASIPGVNLVGLPLLGAAAGVTGLVGAGLDLLDAGSWFGGGDKKPAAPEAEEVLAQAMQEANLSPDQMESILEQYEVGMIFANAAESDEEREALAKQVYTQATQQVLMLAGQQDLMAQAGGGAGNMLALQAQAQDIFDPLAQNIEQSGAMYANAMRGIRDQLPAEFQAITDANVARELSSSQKLANAYRAQAAVTPALNQLTQYQRDYNALAAQAMQQAQAAGLSGGGAATTDIAAMLAPQ